MTTPVILAKQLAYVRVSAPDVAKAETFLQNFGLHPVTQSGQRSYWRGADAGAPCYVLSQGSSAVTAIGFAANSFDDLEEISRSPDASAIEPLDDACEGLSGGHVVRLADPLGMLVEVVYGQTDLEPLQGAPAHDFNMNGDRPRAGVLPGVSKGPSQIKRIGHLVLESADPVVLYQWYHEKLGLTKSDAVTLPDGSPQMIFARLNRGEDYVDHHVVGFQYALDEGTRVQHIAFEVGNLDDLMTGHEHLKHGKYKNVWGVGRHLLGGQIFDYWKSPAGLIHEHWTDTDLVNQQHEASDCAIGQMRDYWGPDPKPGFLVARWNFKVIKNLVTILRARSR